jgi:hypothetical protein
MTAVCCIAPVRTVGPGVSDEDLGIEHSEKLHLDLKRKSLYVSLEQRLYDEFNNP